MALKKLSTLISYGSGNIKTNRKAMDYNKELERIDTYLSNKQYKTIVRDMVESCLTDGHIDDKSGCSCLMINHQVDPDQ